MRVIANVFAMLLIIFGILVLSYQGYHYTQHEEIARVGDIKLVEETQKQIEFPPLLGGLCLASGIIVLLIARIKK